LPGYEVGSRGIEFRKSLELAVAAGNWIESSGLGSWQMIEELSAVQLRVGRPAVKR
jgi:hypothetical protein